MIRRHHVVYSDAMSRTQIYLGEEELALLERASQSTGASRSELIRRAVRSAFGAAESSARLRALQASAGSWDEGPSGADHVDALRGGDLNDRLQRLGVDRPSK
jgi:Arc/MetJ-type ribon-helix-helix transcriptional regulator